MALAGSAAVALALAAHAFGEGLATGALLGSRPQEVTAYAIVNVTMREHTCTGRSGPEVSCQPGTWRALSQVSRCIGRGAQLSAPRPDLERAGSACPLPRRSGVTRGTMTYTDVVQAECWREALQLPAERATASRPLPDFKPQPHAADCPRCADIWVHSLLHCGLEEGHESAAHRRPTRVLASGEVGEGRSWPHPSPAGASHRSAMIPAVTQRLPAPGIFRRTASASTSRARPSPAQRASSCPAPGSHTPACRALLGPMAVRLLRSVQTTAS